jgi:chaperone BCS1
MSLSLAGRNWFRNLNLPFRRGYLLHGPPGNGKTSVIRAMLSRPGMCGLTLNFFSPGVDDDDLQAMFERAGECAPSLVVMEDIDRAFPKNQISGTKCKASMQQLLNCLDGITTKDGVHYHYWSVQQRLETFPSDIEYEVFAVVVSSYHVFSS